MPVLNMVPPNSIGTSTDNSINPRHIMQKNSSGSRRRTRSKGTIAGFNSPDGSDSQPLTADNSSISLDASNHPQHLLGDPLIPTKPCHTAKLALLCVQNANNMGARTQLNLCPPGKARDDMMKALKERRRRRKKALPMPSSMRRTPSFSRSPSIASIGSRADEPTVFEKLMGEAGQAEYDEAEAEYLSNPGLRSLDMNSDGEEMQEDPSSGDEDLLDYIFDDDDKFDDTDDQSVREPLYTLGPEGLTNQGSANSGKLAFNFRKLRWFDSVTATDRAEAREYLRKELSSLKKRDAMTLTKHLRTLQRREKRRLEIEKCRQNGNHSKTSDVLSDTEDDDEGLCSINKLPNNMSASLSAALVLESLSFNPLESLEGMAKCYEGIVAAGTALLDIDDQAAGKKPTKKKIVNALTPLLITTLDQESGGTILALASLRKISGTKRYQRRFIQRIAPSLVRPPGAAIWCLRHQTDMQAILAATELILDSSSEIFASDWFERGRTILADSKRAESLMLAAKQLKRLSSPQHNESMLSSLNGSHHRRVGSLSMNTPTKDSVTTGSNGGTEVLAEWEILAVDREIRDSIKNVFKRDWSKINIRHAPPREGESPHTSKKLRGISAGKSKSAPPPPDPDSSTENHLSPPRVNNSKHLLPNALGLTPSIVSSESISRSPRRGPRHKSLDSPPPATNGPKPSTQLDESPPNTPKRQIQSVGSPVRPSPPPIELASPEPTNVLSPRPGQAPLSPSKKSYRGRNDANRVANNSPGSTTSAQSTYLRTLTSTAAERKRTVAACRALRAQITRFESAFAKAHGRAPRGANERAPLATTYAQYREWKRAIRSDAASRIQAMYRGSRARSILSQDPRLKRIVKNRAGRPAPIRPLPPQMPSDIGNKGQRNVHQPIPPMPLQRRDDPNTAVYDGVEVLLSESQPKSSYRRPVDDQSMNYSTTASTTASLASVPFSPRADGSVSSSNSADFSFFTLPELQAHKRELKQMLKKYDMDFHRQHGRMPVKAEKEPIRNLYENYNTLKNRITSVEKDPSLVSPRIQWQKHTQSPGNANQDSIQTFPDFNSNATESTNQSSSLPSGPRAPNRSSRMQSESSNSLPPAQGQDLQALRTEKQHLHQMLRAYERDFFRINNRQVSSYNDIRPVASQYRRYKEIKKSILALQQSQR